MKNKGVIALIAVMLVLGAVFIFYFKFYNEQSFDISPDYPINLNLIAGTEASSSVIVTNNEKGPHNFKLNVASEVASVSEPEFSLGPKESKEIKIIFSDLRNDSHVLFSRAVITNDFFEREIPVLLTFRSPESLFSVMQKPMPRYFDVYPGGKLGVDISVFDLGIKGPSKEVKAAYELLSPDERILYFEENLVIGDEYEFSKVFDISPETTYGKYVLVTSVEYKGIKSISSYLFEVKPKQNGLFLDKTNLLILIVFAFVILIVVLFVYFVKSRDELLLQLRKQQSRELARNLQLIAAVQKKAPPVKKQKIEKAKERVIKKIKKKQEKQIKEFHKLKKKRARKDVLESQLKRWEKEGYEFPEIKREMPEKSIKAQMAEWKRKGFDTGVLNLGK